MEWLGIDNSSTMSQWKARNRFPIDHAITIANAKKVSLDYLYFREDSAGGNGTAEEPAVYGNPPPDVWGEAAAALRAAVLYEIEEAKRRG